MNISLFLIVGWIEWLMFCDGRGRVLRVVLAIALSDLMDTNYRLLRFVKCLAG